MRWLLAASLVAGLASADYQSALQKLEQIRTDKAQARSAIRFSPREINAFAQGEADRLAPGAIRNARVQLGRDSATARAMVDFERLRKSESYSVAGLLAMLLAGEREVEVSARIRSSAGNCRVDVDRVTISGLRIEGAALQFLLESFLLPYFPDARLGEPFPLQHRVERIEVASVGVRVLIGE